MVDGSVCLVVGIIGVYELFSGFGLWVDGYGYVGYWVSFSYDLLLVKLVVCGVDYFVVLCWVYWVFCEFCLEGVVSNLDLLCNFLLYLVV